MKDFRDYLREFIERTPNNPGGGNSRDPDEELKDFMDNTPFRLNTRQGDLIHFNSSLDAAKMLFNHLEQHEEGHNHAVQQDIPHMIRYFQKSAGTHERALDLLQDRIQNHPNLPVHLRSRVGPVLSRIQAEIQNEHEERKKNLKGKKDMFGRPMDDIGARVAGNYGATPIEIQGEEYHPHQQDEMHHLEGVVGELEDADDFSGSGAPIGYVIRREERDQ